MLWKPFDNVILRAIYVMFQGPEPDLFLLLKPAQTFNLLG